MDFETISNVNASYNTETTKNMASEHKAVTDTSAGVAVSNAASKTVPVTSQVLPSEQKGDADSQGRGQQKEPSEKTIDQTVSQANAKLEHTRCEYSYHKETNRVSIKVIDSNTDKVIREIPPEKTLDMLQKMWEMAGMMVDEKR